MSNVEPDNSQTDPTKSKELNTQFELFNDQNKITFITILASVFINFKGMCINIIHFFGIDIFIGFGFK